MNVKSDDGFAIKLFLSCLCGSELRKRIAEFSRYFLSCLCGSEHHVGQVGSLRNFLSCLCGSERINLTEI